MSNTSGQNTYRQSLKAVSLFGGVQVINILIGIIRSKFVAILLGPEGMGISGLYTSAIGLISSVTSLGLGTSAVRDIAEAEATKDNRRISQVLGVFKKLVWITGLIGTLICIIFSSFLSQATFGSKQYSVGFIVLSITILFLQLTSGQNAILQGLRKYKFLAKANVIGSFVGLILTVPLYYFYGIDAIVPVMVLTSLISLFLTTYYSKKIKIEPLNIPSKSILEVGKSMIGLGFFISLQGLIAKACSYLVRIFISTQGGTIDVGLYNAGFILINTYVGLVFTAMSTEYYPRLAGFSGNNSMMNKTINQQIEIALLILSPIIASFVIFIRPIIQLLYSSKFLPAEGMIYWAIFAIYFKAVSWAIAYTFLAKGDTKTYFWNEMTAGIFHLFLNLLFYYYWGLTGLGISFFIGYVTYLIQVWLICHFKYNFIMNKELVKIFSLQFLLSAICIVLVIFASNNLRYVIGVILILASSYYSFIKLDEKIELKTLIYNKLMKR